MPPATAKPVAAKPAAKPAAAKAPAKPVAAAPAEAVEETAAPRVKLADMSPEEKQAACEPLITELYNAEGTDEETQGTKRKLRAKLRNIDKEWRTTYAEFIQTNWPAPEPEAEEVPAAAAPAAPAKAPAKPAARPAGKPATAPAKK